ncbi:TPA: ATP-binding cassette domain-containing protein [Escherichia coli]|jgi:ABC-type multidrug transport system fused ATPase/permease subunit|uniref:ABC transporter ATP-binding protein n=19 Tax=Enterobacteriaceae TaxID=543 RepID=A0AAI9H3R7_ECOLX|nr:MULTISPECIES: ABC transporter ATP-binding protein [Enterobacteriaceae]EBW3042414.1 ABC transporter ATP-binding protein [Salmonella enterica subsp. enterica serovar Virchow]HBN3968744.1 ABC transporter ATP-binding protein [Escherichia coli O25b:H4-ST131]HBP1538324.1 ABC transporter ATP-binding protein [Escherichia coli str. K-12 substr. MG1655star]AKA93688.1 cysteine/glutathione ABC transporter membrane/ATP-binding protein [Escherichia coli VR50]EAB6864101.1 ABC transporter ATP-binding prote
MKIKNVICELKSGASAYSSAYKLIRSLYPAFTFSFIGVSILFILASVLGALLPYLLKKTAEAYTFSEGILSAFFLITMTYAVSWTVTEVLKNIRGIFSAGILAQADAALTSNTMEILLSISFRKQKEFEPAVLAANIDRGAQSFSALTLSVFWTLLPITVEISMAVYFLYQSLGFTYSLIFSISVIGMIFLAFSIAIFSRHIHTDIMNTQNGVYSYTIERLAMPLDIRINSAHAKERVLRQEILNQYVNTIKLTNKKMGFLLSLQAVAVGVLLAISVLVLVFFKKASHIGTGDFIMIVGYISMLTFQLRTIAGASIDIQRQIVYLKILLEYNSMHPEGVIPDTVSSRSTERIFDVRNLGAFADGRLLFNNVSFRIHEGEMFALSAPSGFGKSTILQYLLGLDTPTEGDIYFRGYRINTELSASILEDVAVVPQKAVLVQGTIRDNILYGTDDILPDDELFCILNSLGLIKEDCGEHFLAFLDRDINPLGSGLSGGEIQRLCIARALARKKKIIVLDEPTASIGEELAIKIITYIRQHCPTVIITTHNPRILELADHFFDGMSKSCVIAGEGRDQ